MQGLYIGAERPKSKKAVKEAIAANPGRVRIEATSMFGNEYDGPASILPEGKDVFFVGPDPYTARRFYGKLVKRDGRLVVT